ncbi:MAG: FMN-binding protein [Pseudomonadota bacterium]
MLLLLFGLAFSQNLPAESVYQTPESFLADAFNNQPPAPEMLWLTEETKATIERILGHRYASLRIRYWRQGERSAWILEEIGKERPITIGFVVNNDTLEKVRVLVFRESRGDEVRHPFFTTQFTGAALRADLALDRPIDGITGATLSVRALIKTARLALYLHRITGQSRQ